MLMGAARTARRALMSCQVLASGLVIILVAAKLMTGPPSAAAVAAGEPVAACLLGYTPRGTNLCHTVHGFAVVSLLATAMLALLAWHPSAAAGGFVPDTLIATAGAALWAVAAVLLGRIAPHSTSPPGAAGAPATTVHMAAAGVVSADSAARHWVIALCWTAAALFGATAFVNLASAVNTCCRPGSDSLPVSNTTNTTNTSCNSTKAAAVAKPATSSRPNNVSKWFPPVPDLESGPITTASGIPLYTFAALSRPRTAARHLPPTTRGDLLPISYPPPPAASSSRAAADGNGGSRSGTPAPLPPAPPGFDPGRYWGTAAARYW